MSTVAGGPRGALASRFAMVLGLLALSALLRSGALGAGYWIDEGLSVGIASHPLGELPSLLRQDGSPPLHYALLHGWIAAFGDGERATHALSLVFALATVPAAWWAARRPLGTAAASAAAALAAANPFLTQYAQETRPYALAVLLGTLLTGAYLRAFLLRDRRALVPTALLAAALALTHHWGLYLLAGFALCTVVLGRRVLRDGLLAGGVTVAVYTPWLGVTIDQVRHTGAPWSITPGLGELPDVLLVPLGGLVPVLLLGGAAALALVRRNSRRPAAAQGDAAAAMIALAVAAAFAAAFAGAQLEPGWAGRYLAVYCGPLLMAAAWAVARAGVAGAAMLAVVLAVWVADGPPERKSNVREVAASLSSQLSAGDLVIAAHPEQVAVARHYFGARLRYATTLGPQADPRVFDWRHALARLDAADPGQTLAEVRRHAPTARRIVLLLPVLASTENRGSSWVRLVRARARAWERLLAGDRDLLRAPAAGERRPPRRGVRAAVYRRTRTS